MRSLLLATAVFAFATPAQAQPAALDAGLALERARLAAGHLLTSEIESGAFVYEYDLLAGRPTDDENVVRQAGAGYALSQFLNIEADTDFVQRAGRALSY